MNGSIQRSHFSLRLGDVSPEVRCTLWKHVLTSFVVSGGVLTCCVGLLWWLVG